jgi:hypothetical protein
MVKGVNARGTGTTGVGVCLCACVVVEVHAVHCSGGCRLVMLYFYFGLIFVVTRWRKLRTVDFKRFARTREEAESVSFS